MIELSSHLFGLLHFGQVLLAGLVKLGLELRLLVSGIRAVSVGPDALVSVLLALRLNLLLLAIIFSVLRSFLVFDILELFFLMMQLGLNCLEIGNSSLVKLREALEGFLGHRFNFLALSIHVNLASSQVLVELVNLIQARNLPLFIVHDIFLLFSNVINCRLNLGCQILLEHLKIVLLLLVLEPAHGFLLFLEHVDLLCG